MPALKQASLQPLAQDEVCCFEHSFQASRYRQTSIASEFNAPIQCRQTKANVPLPLAATTPNGSCLVLHQLVPAAVQLQCLDINGTRVHELEHLIRVSNDTPQSPTTNQSPILLLVDLHAIGAQPLIDRPAYKRPPTSTGPPKRITAIRKGGKWYTPWG